MNVLIIGTGYVGTTTGLVFCEMGHNVTGLDLNEEKIESLQKGKLHFFEPGLEELLKKHVKTKKIKFTTDTENAIKENDIIFICVGTPQDKDGGADLGYVKNVAHSIGRSINKYKVIVNKSTVPVGTAELVREWVKEVQNSNIEFDVVSNPEFLREGSALKDALKPDRIVIGGTSERSIDIMNNLYVNFTCPIIVTKPKAAELIKYAANSFLALKISYINELARLCDVLDISIQDISEGIGLDHRIGRSFLNAGIGYGGSCFPKDVNALLFTSQKNNIELSILKDVVEVNRTQPNYFLEKIKNTIGRIENCTVSVLGLSFKPETDDTRESPSLVIIEELLGMNYRVNVHDPVVRVQNNNVNQFNTIYETVANTDAVLICTDWDEYKKINWSNVKNLMRHGNIFDGRNIVDKYKVKELGFNYHGIGNN